MEQESGSLAYLTRKDESVICKTHGPRLETNTKPAHITLHMLFAAKTKRKHAVQVGPSHTYSIILNGDCHAPIINFISIDVNFCCAAFTVLRAVRVE